MTSEPRCLVCREPDPEWAVREGYGVDVHACTDHTLAAERVADARIVQKLESRLNHGE